MKHKGYICILLLAFFLAPLSLSLAEEVQALSPDDGDSLQRIQLRLSDLGYYQDAISGADSSALESALHAFRRNNGDETGEALLSRLFSSAAKAAILPRTVSTAQDSNVVLTGEALPWEKAFPLLTLDACYTITSCYTGVSCRLRYMGGSGHAHMTPWMDEDAEALRILFDNLRDYGKQPVVIELDGRQVAASLQGYLHTDDAGDADTTYSLYFTDSVSDIGGLADVDHAANVHIAAGGR